MPGASKIEELTNAPGGGSRVTIYDPEGFPVNLLYGQELVEPGQLPKKLVYNFEEDKSRIGSFQRFTAGPAAVHKVITSQGVVRGCVLTKIKARPLWSLCS